MVNTPFPTNYIEEDAEALETSFQELEIVGTTSLKTGRGDIKSSKVAIVVAKVLIANSFELGKGLGRRLNGMANTVAIQENPRRVGLSYSGAVGKAKLGRKVQNKQKTRANLYYHFISGGIVTPKHVAMVDDQPREPAEWVYLMAPNTKTFPQINNVALAPDDAGKSNRQDEGEEMEEETLRELERPKLQSSNKKLEIINLEKGEETREIRISKIIPSDSKKRLTKLLREYKDIFAWTYRDMPGLDTAIVEHRLPLIPNAIPVRQQLRRMKPKVALKIKEEVEKQWKVGFWAVAEYPQWVANNVPIPKKDGKVYNQFWMAPEDKEKTTFVIVWGTFYYKVMPFRLKNVGATF
ncbi:hypothetical protein CR513_47600, partial [Mucuna pruriens]